MADLPEKEQVYETANRRALAIMDNQKTFPWLTGPNQIAFDCITGGRQGGLNDLLFRLSGHDDARWVRREDALELSYSIRAGERATRKLETVTEKMVPVRDDDGEIVLNNNGRMVMEKVQLERAEQRAVPYFNVSQLENFPPPEARVFARSPIERGNEILLNSGIPVKFDQKNTEFYHPRLNEIHMRPPQDYGTSEKYIESGLYALAQGMANDNRVNRAFRSDESDDQIAIRDQMAVQMAHATLCNDVGVPVDPSRNITMLGEMRNAMAENPYLFFEAAKFASRIHHEVAQREQNRNPDRREEIREETTRLKFSSPRQEMERLQDARDLLQKAQTNPESVYVIQQNGVEIVADRDKARVYRSPSQLPESGQPYDITLRAAGVDQTGKAYDVLITNSYDGSNNVVGEDRYKVRALPQRDCSFPLDWNGNLSAQPMVYTPEGDLQPAPGRDGDCYAVQAERENGEKSQVALFDTKDYANQFIKTNQNAYDRQTGNTRERDTEGMTFFYVDYNDRQGQNIARKLPNFEYVPAAKSWAALPGADLTEIRQHFKEHDPYKRMADIAARKEQRVAERAQKPVLVVDVPKHREAEARYLGVVRSQKFDCWFIPDKVHPDTISKRFTVTEVQRQQQPQQNQQQQEQSAMVLHVPVRDIDRAMEAGAVYDTDTGRWAAAPDADLTKLQEWSEQNQLCVQAVVTPQQEAAMKLEALGIDLQGQPPIMTGEVTSAAVKGDIENQLNASYVLYPDGSGQAANALTMEEITINPVGYHYTPAEVQMMKEEVYTRLLEEQAVRFDQYDKTAERLAAQFEKMKPLTTPTPYMAEKGIDVLPGMYAKKDSVVIPLKNAKGEIRSAVTIQADGSMSIAPKSQSTGTHAIIGGRTELGKSTTILVTNQLDTGAAFASARGTATVIAFGEHNVVPTARALHEAHPNAKIVIAQDGISNSTAKTAAMISNGTVIQPKMSEKDVQQGTTTFAEIAKTRGKETLTRQIMDHERKTERQRVERDKAPEQEKQQGKTKAALKR